MGLIPVQGLTGEKPQAGAPGLRVSQQELEQHCEPLAWHFLRAFHFLFCLCAKVLSISAGGRAEASCLPSHRGDFLPAQMEEIPSEAFIPQGLAWLALIGTQLSCRPGQGWD